MASKVIEGVRISLSTDFKTGEATANCSAVCFSPDIGAQFGVSVPLVGEGVTELLESAVIALKEHLAQGGHTVTEAEPEPES